ncbi:MAG: phosphoribosylaminoimidazolesuccinocarboxamide synthase [Holophaga sp.]|nr:phosphoribosylaminoimidazolesuccinocarboxamide synthase [Holophaga sp.]
MHIATTPNRTKADLPFPLFRSGKVRDVFDLGETLLIVASDRISAFDCVMPEGIPDKGRILTQVANFWFDATKDIVPNHLVTTDFADFPKALQSYREALEGRSVIVKKAKPFPVECIVRGYLAGSAFKEYKVNGAVCGIGLPPGLKMADRLPEPLFTPSTKAEEGHDENITLAEMMDVVGEPMTNRLKAMSLALYERGHHIARERGILLADTKFEFGLLEDGSLILIDEVLTPDSSRYWLAEQWQSGSNPPSLDKQYLRDYLETLEGWGKTPPAPHLPAMVIEGVRERYMDLARRFGVTL